MAFDELTFKDVKAKLATPAGYAENKAFYDGDHWQNGVGWSGPMPADGDSGATEAQAAIQKGFVSSNEIRGLAQRFVDGLIGKEPAWGFTVARPLEDDEQPTPQEQELIDETEAALTDMWDKRGLQRTMQQVLVYALLGGFAMLRQFYPAAFVGEKGIVKDGDAPTQMKRLRFNALEPTQAVILIDDDTQAEAAVYVYKKGDTERAELVFLTDEDEPLTVVRVFEGDTFDDSPPLDLGGRLTMQSLDGPVLITEQVRQLQRSLNKSLTMMQHNENLAGFAERTLLNTQLNGETIEQGGRKYFKPDPIARGPGAISSFVGIPIEDNAGNLTGYATPSIYDRDPTSPDTFIASQDAYTLRLLKEGDQLHVAISGDATASGESRKQARAGFEAALRRWIAQVERMGRDALETAAATGAALANQPGRYAGLRATFQCRVDIGPIGADEQRVAAELFAARGFDLEEFMARIGVQDIDAVKARLAQEAAERAARAPQITAQPEGTTNEEDRATNQSVPA